MKISIIGAGAGVGLQSVLQALEKGHTVTALSTNTTTLLDHPLLTKINGSATSLADMKTALQGAEAVLITVGTKNKKATTLFSDIAKTLIQAAAELNFTAPILVITGFGAGESGGYLSFFMRTIIRFFLKDQYADKTLMEKMITKSPLKWEIVRPGMLTNGASTQTYKVLPTLFEGMKVGKISRADVAHFLINEAENPSMIYQYPSLTS
jgi:putative NADH-flavin reductase